MFEDYSLPLSLLPTVGRKLKQYNQEQIEIHPDKSLLVIPCFDSICNLSVPEIHVESRETSECPLR